MYAWTPIFTCVCWWFCLLLTAFFLIIKVAKQGRVNFPQQDYATSVSFSQIPQRKNQTKGWVHTSVILWIACLQIVYLCAYFFLKVMPFFYFLFAFLSFFFFFFWLHCFSFIQYWLYIFLLISSFFFFFFLV